MQHHTKASGQTQPAAFHPVAMKSAVALAVLGLGCLAFTVGALAQSVAALPTTLPTTQGQRIHDGAISTDHQAMAALQTRLQKLNEAGLPVQGYHFAKAQCWLDFAFHEYHQNDRTGVIEDAMRQSAQLTGLLEQRVSGLPTDQAVSMPAAQFANLPVDTPHPASATPLRPDLWARLQALKTKPGAACAAARTACAEVRLVWAGHELKQTGWRHASPWVGVAEDLIADAEREEKLCPAPLAPPAPPPVAVLPPPPPAVVPAPAVEAPKPAPVALPPPPARQPEPVASLVHFALDQHRLSPASTGVLDRVAAVLRANPAITVNLIGHTDVRASSAYNHRLAQRRVHGVRGYLVAAGVDAQRIQVQAMGLREPMAQGTGVLDHANNRRVEIQYQGAGSLQLMRQVVDLQPER